MALSLAWGIDDSIEINENKYVLNLEFSLILRWYQLWKDKEISEDEKINISLEMLLNTPANKIPDKDLVQLIDALIARIVGDTQTEAIVRDHAGNILEEGQKQLYDLEEDADYIYASFLAYYGIDLMEARENKTLHWDKFNALLIGLSDETKFKQVIDIRQMKIPPKATPEEIEKIKQAKKAVALKSNREQIEFEMMDLKQKREYMQKKAGEANGE